MILGISGHRPPKCFPWKIPNPQYLWLKDQLKKKFLELNASAIITGMALGADTLAAQTAIELKIKHIAAIPCDNQEALWFEKDKILYHQILKQSTIKNVCPGEYAKEKFQKRNIWIVDNCNILLAVFDGSPSGTANCISYAEDKNKKIIIINPKDCCK